MQIIINVFIKMSFDYIMLLTKNLIFVEIELVLLIAQFIWQRNSCLSYKIYEM